jgi:lipoyl(octanoyl) transferase
MAVDEWLLETAEVPTLRIYRWQGGWGSLGYFGKLGEARVAVPGVEWVRRWTGGGIVDHRADWTYTLVVPRPHPLALAKGAASYAIIHGALLAALREQDVRCRPSCGVASFGSGVCFNNPVEHDLVDPEGRKVAGAGQRRTSRALLHQGSVVLADAPEGLAESLARQLDPGWESADLRPPPAFLTERVARKYADGRWTARR